MTHIFIPSKTFCHRIISLLSFCFVLPNKNIIFPGFKNYANKVQKRQIHRDRELVLSQNIHRLIPFYKLFLDTILCPFLNISFLHTPQESSTEWLPRTGREEESGSIC